MYFVVFMKKCMAWVMGLCKFSSALGLSNRNMMNMPLSCIHNPRRPDAGPFSFLSGGNSKVEDLWK